jgi:uridine kinase
LASLVAAEKSRENRTVLLLAGGGCIGKTTLMSKLQSHIGKPICEHVELDGYMLPREEAGGLTGYDPRRFELGLAKRQLEGLVFHGKPFELHLYNRKTHKRDIIRQVEPKKVILIEGGLALRDEFLPFGNVNVFLDSSEEVQFLLRLKRESVEFGYTEEQVKKRFEKYYPDYLKYILPTRENAGIILRTDENYNVTIQA